MERVKRRLEGPPGEVLLQARHRAQDVVSRTLSALGGKSSEDRDGVGDVSGHIVFDSKIRDRRRKEKRRKERQEFIGQGGIIREVDLGKEPKVAEAIAVLYRQSSAIEHFADVTPFTTEEDMDNYYRDHPLPPTEERIPPTNPQEIRKYYKKNPGAKLLIAEIDGEVVGAVTVVRTKGLSEAKLNRVVTKEDKLRRGIAYLLVREGVVKSFAEPEQGGFGVNSIVIGFILDVEGSEAPRRLFEEFEFENTIKFKDRCFGWDNKEKQLVYRDVQQMALQKGKALDRWRADIKAGTSFTKKEAA